MGARTADGSGRRREREVRVTHNLPVAAGRSRDRTWETRRLASTLLLSEADRLLLDAIRPRCAKCGRPVERMMWTPIFGKAGVLFRVECHGAADEMLVGFDMLPTILAGAVQGAEVFKDVPKLEHER